MAELVVVNQKFERIQWNCLRSCHNNKKYFGSFSEEFRGNWWNKILKIVGKRLQIRFKGNERFNFKFEGSNTSWFHQLRRKTNTPLGETAVVAQLKTIAACSILCSKSLNSISKLSYKISPLNIFDSNKTFTAPKTKNLVFLNNNLLNLYPPWHCLHSQPWTVYISPSPLFQKKNVLLHLHLFQFKKRRIYSKRIDRCCSTSDSFDW
jgi:hypothetical protein